MSGFTDKINANVCYCQTYYMERYNLLSYGDAYSKITAPLKQRFSGVAPEDGGEQPQALEEIKIAEGFLHGGNLPFETRRVLLRHFNLSHNVLPIRSSAVMVSFFPEIGIVMVMVNLTLKGAATDQMVFLRHMQGNGELLTQRAPDGTETQMTISQVTEQVAEAMGDSLHKSQSAYIVEVNGISDYERLEDIVENESNRLYGILTGDEGWEYLPDGFAGLRITRSTWSSRKYVSVVDLSSNFLLVNLNSGIDAGHYIEHQKKFFGEFYGEMNTYFLMRSSFAGVNHGLLFAVETGMAIKSFSHCILDSQSFYRTAKQKSFRAAIRQIKEFRRQIILTLNKVEDMQMSEMGELQELVLAGLKIDPVIDRLKYLLELMESEMDLMYTSRTNLLVNLIAIVGLIFSLMQVLGMFVDF